MIGTNKPRSRMARHVVTTTSHSSHDHSDLQHLLTPNAFRNPDFTIDIVNACQSHFTHALLSHSINANNQPKSVLCPTDTHSRGARPPPPPSGTPASPVASAIAPRLHTCAPNPRFDCSQQRLPFVLLWHKMQPTNIIA